MGVVSEKLMDVEELHIVVAVEYQYCSGFLYLGENLVPIRDGLPTGNELINISLEGVHGERDTSLAFVQGLITYTTGKVTIGPYTHFEIHDILEVVDELIKPTVHQRVSILTGEVDPFDGSLIEEPKVVTKTFPILEM